MTPWASSNKSPTTTKDSNFPITNIVLMGQFNWDTPLDKILWWVKIWSKYFLHISVVGPFAPEIYQLALELGVDIHMGEMDQGYVSPIANLAQALVRAPAGTIDAVLYLHDDALLNLSSLMDANERIPTDRFIGTLPGNDTAIYSLTVPDNATTEESIIYQLHVGSDSTPTDRPGFLTELNRYKKWTWTEKCLNDIVNMLLKDNKNGMQEYASSITEQGASYLCLHEAQMDVLLVPMVYRESFVRIANYFVNSQVFLECALPNIIFWVLREEMLRENKEMNAVTSPMKDYYYSTPAIFHHKATRVPLCTRFLYGRGTTFMIKRCLQQQPSGYAMFHPFKMSVHSAKNFSLWLDRVQHPWNVTYEND